MDTEGIGISNLPNQIYRTVCKKGVDYNIMVVGASGLGKTTFVNMLMGKNILEMEPFCSMDGKKDIEISARKSYHLMDSSGACSLTDFDQVKNNWNDYENSGLLSFQTTEITIVEKKFKVCMTVTEVDEIGDSVCNIGVWEPILKYIETKFKDYYKQETEKVKSKIEDRRIHACIYFIEPCGSFIKEVDIKTMKGISQYCNLIPVISQSDLLTDTEMSILYENFRNILEKQEIGIFEGFLNNEKDVSEYVLPPFFLVTAQNKYTSHGIVRERIYPWGIIDVDTISFNDFNRLKSILVKNNLFDLIQSTEHFYENFRAKEFSSYFLDGPLMSHDEKRVSVEFLDKLKAETEQIVVLRNNLAEKRKPYEKTIKELEKELEEIGKFKI
ncbi:septin [Hamiltosporidium magnivora]|uniref:Septin n=1 Tax=Hamiltosporidium magnivora TaxID=148818 RepID=A0A4Q9L7C1_9MICR|nr:Septin spn4 [Hamiltosporidium tvaerminnensis]TBU02560.1 septin [Hamiltosporidium magnivora]